MLDLYVALFSIPVSAVMYLSVRKIWLWYKAKPYTRSTILSDAWLAAAAASVFPFFNEVVPLLEQLCLTSGQHSALGPFRIPIALFVTLSVLGIIVGDEDGRKVSASILVFSLLIGAAYRVFLDNEPCHSLGAEDVLESSDIDLLGALNWIIAGVGFTAAALYIWEFVTKRRGSRSNLGE